MGSNKSVLVIIAVALLAILGVLIVGSAHRTPGQKIGDGFHDIGQGISDSVNHATH